MSMPPSTPAREPLRELQQAAARAAEHISPGERAVRVVVFVVGGAKLLDVAVPSCCCGKDESKRPGAPEPLAAGWVVTARGAQFDGAPVPVAASRLQLLRVLVEADGPLTAKELTAQAFDRNTDVANTRYHLRELRKELKAAFTFDDEVIQGDDEGYRLVLR